MKKKRLESYAIASHIGLGRTCTNTMLPSVFQEELNKLAKLNAAYKEQLDKVVDIIEDTYGHSPYDVDCDFFIDTYCQGAGNMTVKQLDEQMRLCCP